MSRLFQIAQVGCVTDALTAFAERRRPRLLDGIVASFGTLAAAALFLGVFDGGLLPEPARAEGAAPVALADGGGLARPSSSRLCFHGPGGELLDSAPSKQHCP